MDFCQANNFSINILDLPLYGHPIDELMQNESDFVSDLPVIDETIALHGKPVEFISPASVDIDDEMEGEKQEEEGLDNDDSPYVPIRRHIQSPTAHDQTPRRLSRVSKPSFKIQDNQL